MLMRNILYENSMAKDFFKRGLKSASVNSYWRKTYFLWYIQKRNFQLISVLILALMSCFLLKINFNSSFWIDAVGHFSLKKLRFSTKYYKQIPKWNSNEYFFLIFIHPTHVAMCILYSIIWLICTNIGKENYL